MAKKSTVKQMAKKSTVKQKVPVTATLEHCNLYGVYWDAAATQAVQTIADGLLANAKAMDKLIDVFKAQNVQINNLLTIGAKGE